jgi:hypothetical protein
VRLLPARQRRDRNVLSTEPAHLPAVSLGDGIPHLAGPAHVCRVCVALPVRPGGRSQSASLATPGGVRGGGRYDGRPPDTSERGPGPVTGLLHAVAGDAVVSQRPLDAVGPGRRGGRRAGDARGPAALPVAGGVDDRCLPRGGDAAGRRPPDLWTAAATGKRRRSCRRWDSAGRHPVCADALVRASFHARCRRGSTTM